MLGLGPLGYTNLGHRLRARGFAPLPSMDGAVAVVTGATSGLGQAAAEGFAALGAHVILVVRDAERGERVRAAIGPESATVARCDLSSLADVRALAATLPDRIEVVVHNAGVLPPKLTRTGEGHELTFATNVLGPFLLTALLQDRARRVVNVSSGGMYTKKLDVAALVDPPGGDAFSGTRAYANTKRAEVVLTELWAQRLDPARAVVHAMHPGWADTPGLAESLPGFHRLMGPLLRDTHAGADTIVWLGAAREPLATSGRFWLDRAPQPTHYVPWTRESGQDRARLWDAGVAATGATAGGAGASAGAPAP
jgi:NAD(P)-dependent dehydrogenase (short-subunit alcohol dehydrogenase family)